MAELRTIAGITVPVAVTLVAKPVVDRLIERIKPGKDSISLADVHEVLNYGLKNLGDSEVWRDIKQKDVSEDYKHWKERVSNIRENGASLDREYDEVKRRHIPKSSSLKENIKKALSEVIKLLEECREETMPERVIKEVGVPSMEEYPTLQKIFQEVLSLLQSVSCIELQGQRICKTTLMKYLNNHFYDNRVDEKFKFDVVIFIKVATDEQINYEKELLSILQKIADRIGVDRKGDYFDITRRIQTASRSLRYLLILQDIQNITTFDHIASERCLNISKGDSKALPLEEESLLRSTSSIGKPTLAEDVLRLMRMRDLIHAILSYPMRIDGYEDFLKRWIRDVYQLRFAYDDDADSLRRRVEHLSKTSLRYLQALIPEDITTEIINGGTNTPPKQVPQPILHLATRLALHQLTLTLTSHRQLEFDDSFGQLEFDTIKNIWFSTRDDEEKRNVVEKIQANSRIREEFNDLEIVDLNHFIDEIEREKGLLKPETTLEQAASAESSITNYGRRRLVVVVDEDGDKKADSLCLSSPINDSKNVVVFITTQSSNDYLTNNVDLTIRTEDHLLPWELFCKIVGSELLDSSIPIQDIAVKIVEKCGGHLLATILMAKSLQDETDVQIWELALKKLLYRDREPIVNAFIFNIIRGSVISERDKVHLLRCLMVFKFQDWKNSASDDQSSTRLISQQLVGTEEEAKSILQNFIERFLLLQFGDTSGRHIILPKDLKIILFALWGEIPEDLSEEALESTISDLQFFNLSNTHRQHLYDVGTRSDIRYLNLDGCTVETLPKVIVKLKKLESLSLKHCTQLLELPPQIAELENLKELMLARCEQLKTLPQEIGELKKLKTLSLEHCSQLLELPPLIAELENLEELMLARCEQLKTLPQEIGELKKLKTLYLEHCSQLLELPPLIAKFENLKELRLAGCTRLETLPQEIWELPKLHILRLPGTSISPASENQDLINSNYKPRPSSSGHDEHSGRGKGIPSSSSNITPSDFILRLKVHGGSKQLEQLCKKIMQLQIQNLENCNLSGAPLTDLPHSLNFPQLKSLKLGNNLNLMKIPPPFLDHVPLLNILDLSRTSIHELPDSIFGLKELGELHLEECELFAELPIQISQLENLTTLNLYGTLITHLPKQIERLRNLESLSLSFYDDGSKHGSNIKVIPFGVLLRLTHLRVLKIEVNSNSEWWSDNIVIILEQIYKLEKLEELELYIPKVEFSTPIKDSLSNFKFIMGYHKPRMISRVQPAIEAMYKKYGRSLKFVNGEGFPDRVKSILSKSNAFYLDRHMKINNLDQFGLWKLKQIQLYILAECNEMQSIIDVDKYGADPSDRKEPLCMQFLTIFYMKSLRSILNKPCRDSTIFCKLKLLALHTCPELTTIFTTDSINSLVNLEELIVEDCPNVSSVISLSPSEPNTGPFLPRLRKLSLLFVPELSSISNGVRIGENMEQLGLYYCPKLRCLSPAELPSEKLNVIRGEMEWWEKLDWSEWGQEDPPNKFSQIFSEFNEDLDILTQMAHMSSADDIFNR